MWQLWQRTRGGMSIGTLGNLPEAGGINEQHAPTMDALDVITGAWSWLDEQDRKRHERQARRR